MLSINGEGIITSNVADGTAPFVVTSTTKVTNLNADLLDDQEGSYYLNYNNFTNKPAINDATLELKTSGIATGSATFTANDVDDETFTVNVPGTNLSVGTVTATNVPINSSTGNDITTLPAATDLLAGIVTNGTQSFGGAKTFRAANAIRSEVSSGKDAVIISGRNGGTSSYATTLTPGTLTSSNTITLPTTTGTLATLAGTETFTNKTLTAPDINGGTTDSLTSLSVRDTSAAYDLTIAGTSSTPLTAGRKLTIDVVNADRTLKLASSSTINAFASGHVLYASAANTISGEAQLAVSRGGTNITTYAKGDILYASAANVLSKLTKGTDGQVLKLASGLPVWGTLDLTSGTNVTVSNASGVVTFSSPSLSITNGSGNYVSGISVDGHKITETKANWPTFNQNTTGTAAKADTLKTITIDTNANFYPTLLIQIMLQQLMNRFTLMKGFYYNPYTNTLNLSNLSVTGTLTTNNVEMIETSNGVVFEGTTKDGFETTLYAIDPTGC